MSHSHRESAVVILALCPPEKTEALKLAVWTASMLRVAIGQVRLIVAGRSHGALLERLANWERMWLSPGMVTMANPTVSWADLLATCDVVLSTEARVSQKPRLEQALAQGKAVITVPGDAQALGADGLSMIIAGGEARSLAGAILKYLERNGRVFETVGIE